jgi:hypothetical protein
METKIQGGEKEEGRIIGEGGKGERGKGEQGEQRLQRKVKPCKKKTTAAGG